MRPGDLDRLKTALAKRYRFERELGTGAFATVFVARDLRHDRPVAVKVLHRDPKSELNELRFLQEIRFLASLQHPNIVPVHDSGHVDDNLYYVMPYVRGETLRGRIGRERRLPIADALAVSVEVADALAYAHEQGVIHRDIKPENILLSGRHAMLADFGIARAIYASRSRHITKTGFGSPGTPAYMSPEQLLGEHQIDHRADIYSLGCVLFEMLTGATPFSGPDAATKRFVEDAPFTSSLRGDVPSELDALIAKALARVPQNRFASASELRQALITLQRGASGPDGRPVAGAKKAVDTSPLATDVRVGESQVSTPTGFWPPRKVRLLIALAGIAAVVLAARATGLLSSSVRTHDKTNAERIAVLEFEDQSQNHQLGHIALGLGASLVQELSSVSGLQVVSRNAVRTFAGSGRSIDSLLHNLRVGTIVDGAVQLSGNQLRVTVNLVDAPTNTLLESAAVQRPMGELFLLEDDVAHEVAVLLRQRLGIELHLRQITGGTKNARAQELVFRADKLRDEATGNRSFGSIDRVATTVAMLRTSDSLLADAERADRAWVVPIVHRGRIALDLAQRQSGTEQAESLQRAIDLADRALERDTVNNDALQLRGTALYTQAARLDLRDPEFGDRLARAEKDLELALAHSNHLASAWGTLALVRVAQGRVLVATQAAEKAFALDTYIEDGPTILYALYAANLMNDDLPATYHWCERGARDYPEQPRFIECKLTLMAEDSRGNADTRAAWSLYRRADSLDPPAQAAATGRAYSPIYRLMTVAIVLARAGQADSARAVARIAERLAVGSSELQLYLSYEQAYLHLTLGERADAIRLLSTYLSARPSLRSLVGRHPRWRPLRNDPAFRALVQPTQSNRNSAWNQHSLSNRIVSPAPIRLLPMVGCAPPQLHSG